MAALGGVLDRSLVRKREPMNASSGDIDEDIRSECMKSFRILLNTEPGFMMVLSSQMVISKIAFCLYTSNDKLRTTVAEVLAAVCVISGVVGHRMVLTAFGDFKGFFNERYRFEYLVGSLINADPLGNFECLNLSLFPTYSCIRVSRKQLFRCKKSRCNVRLQNDWHVAY